MENDQMGYTTFCVPVDRRDFGVVYDWKCINGVLYYFASVLLNSYHGFSHIVCFDIRSEKFSYIRKKLKTWTESLKQLL